MLERLCRVRIRRWVTLVKADMKHPAIAPAPGLEPRGELVPHLLGDQVEDLDPIDDAKKEEPLPTV